MRRAFVVIGLAGGAFPETGEPIEGVSFPKPFVPAGISAALGVVSVLRASPTAGVPPGINTGGLPSSRPGWAIFAGNAGDGLYFCRQFLQFSHPTRTIPAQIRPTITTTGFLPIGIPFPVNRATRPRITPARSRTNVLTPPASRCREPASWVGAYPLLYAKSRGLRRTSSIVVSASEAANTLREGDLIITQSVARPARRTTTPIKAAAAEPVQAGDRHRGRAPAPGAAAGSPRQSPRHRRRRPSPGSRVHATEGRAARAGGTAAGDRGSAARAGFAPSPELASGSRPARRSSGQAPPGTRSSSVCVSWSVSPQASRPDATSPRFSRDAPPRRAARRLGHRAASRVLEHIDAGRGKIYWIRPQNPPP